MINIVHIIPRLYLAGAERMALLYAQGLDKTKFKITVASSVEDGSLRPLLEDTGVEIIVGSKKKYGNRWGVWKFLKQELTRIAPAIIHTHLLGADIIGYLWKRIHPEVIWISTAHNVEYNSPWIKRFLWKCILRQVDSVIAVSDAVAVYVCDHFQIPKEKITTVYNGIDVMHWKKIPFREFDPQNIQLGTIGRLEEQKGHYYMLRALAQIADVPWTYHVFGEGSLEQSLKREATRLGLSSRIIWHGQTDAIESAIATLDVIVQPSLFEGMSLVVLEALASGRVLIATDAAGEGIIQNGKTGIIVPSKDSDSLAVALRQLFSWSPTAYTKIAKQARADAIKRFDIAEHYRAIENVYDVVMNAR